MKDFEDVSRMLSSFFSMTSCRSLTKWKRSLNQVDLDRTRLQLTLGLAVLLHVLIRQLTGSEIWTGFNPSTLKVYFIRIRKFHLICLRKILYNLLLGSLWLKHFENSSLPHNVSCFCSYYKLPFFKGKENGFNCRARQGVFVYVGRSFLAQMKARPKAEGKCFQSRSLAS